MQPFVHPVVGYVCVAVYSRLRWDERPDASRTTAEAPALAAIVGGALPDLLDKPPWLAGSVPVGRTLGHSLLFALPVAVAGWLVGRRLGRERVGTAFAIGYLSHVATDVPWHLLAGAYDELRFLLWPVTQTPSYSGTKPLGAIGGVEVTTLWLEAAILVGGIALWWIDGRPGLGLVRGRDGE